MTGSDLLSQCLTINSKSNGNIVKEQKNEFSIIQTIFFTIGPYREFDV